MIVESLCKERLVEIPSGLSADSYHIMTLIPVNLKVVPHPRTE
jgi:hypothetical protein